MTTWATFLAEMRTDLQDTGATPRWSNSVIALYLKDALMDYSTWFPLRVDRLALTPTNDKYVLPSNYVEDIEVECPEDCFLEKRFERPGAKYPRQYPTLSYYTSGGSLYLSGSPNGDLLLTYFSTHPCPASAQLVFDPTAVVDPDAANPVVEFVFTVPDADMELLRMYVKAKVFKQMQGRQAALDRFKQGTGPRDDNPLLPETGDLMTDYYKLIAMRIKGGTITLYRVGRMK